MCALAEGKLPGPARPLRPEFDLSLKKETRIESC
jgi:hypothetical protein